MRGTRFDLKSLRYFVAAVDAQSISGAASECFVAQPSITHAISKLEGELKCALLIRHAKGVEPSKKGLEFYHLARDLLSHAQSIEQQFDALDEPMCLTLSVHPSIRIDYVGTLLRRFEHIGPAPKIELISDELADIRITTKSLAGKHALFLPLASETYSLLLPQTHLLAHRQALSVQDLSGAGFIERRHCENQALFDKALAHLNLALHTVAKVETEEWALALVRSGVGCTIAPLDASFKDAHMKRIELSELLPIHAPERQIGVAYAPHLSSEKQALLAHAFHLN